ncbi:MAG TPA: acetyl-CoA decarbonylase/synthase complex subunit delta [Spirochaetia bacterium]|nr:acetyl-CoA decarbonylase/synthase complex subunit delta [Spirochaetia bacterium]
MSIPDVRETYAGRINAVTIGATAADGGTRSRTVTIGGHTTIPFLRFEGETRPPAVGFEVPDTAPDPAEWPDAVLEPYRDVAGNPVAWAKKCVEEYKADMICIRLQSTHPDRGNAPPEKARDTVLAIREAVKVPLMIWGSDDDPKDNQVMPVVSQALAGERCLLGMASQENYKTLTAACLADGHNIVGLSPLDINIAKQVNILVSDMGFPPERIVMYPTTGGLGYGMEYAYSIMERGRLAALAADKMMAMPVLCVVGAESWRAKEARASDADSPAWGPAGERGPMWEAITAVSLLQAGADILLLRHPRAAEVVRNTISELMADGGNKS